MKLDDLFEKMADSADAKESFAKTEKEAFAKAEKSVFLPKSGAASFMRIVGVLGVVVGIFSMGVSLLGGLIVILSSGFLIAAAALQQSVYDIRTILLRDRNDSKPGVGQ